MPAGYPRTDLYTEEMSEQICSLYNSGLTIAEVAGVVGCSSGSIDRVLRHFNIQKRPPGMIGRRHDDNAKCAIAEANRSRKSGETSWVTTDGYICVYKPDHPHADKRGFIKQHRLVMEAVIGRLLLPTEVVHHINCVKRDNNPSNLSLFNSASDHSKHHAKKKEH